MRHHPNWQTTQAKTLLVHSLTSPQAGRGYSSSVAQSRIVETAKHDNATAAYLTVKLGLMFNMKPKIAPKTKNGAIDSIAIIRLELP
ncbi:hypothethical protein [Ralstonia solanacearum PSI07]|uniref:Hypothethical protein n=1 Tax=blood disease bacterium R229 TaxID=741978 RepID=G2ZMI2_9RALS|nr:hypothethical protein [Ralstonia solanacearum PSI07]CCA79792.1 hypothethical protein [blood disease bacterium R229]